MNLKKAISIYCYVKGGLFVELATLFQRQTIRQLIADLCIVRFAI